MFGLITFNSSGRYSTLSHPYPAGRKGFLGTVEAMLNPLKTLERLFTRPANMLLVAVLYSLKLHVSFVTVMVLVSPRFVGILPFKLFSSDARMSLGLLDPAASVKTCDGAAKI